MWKYMLFGPIGVLYSYFNKESNTPDTRCKSLGSFVIWGRPNTGKTTFIARLRGVEVNAEKKEATTSKKVYKNVEIGNIEGGLFKVSEIVDMPGSMDRLDDWLDQVVSKKHVFYLIDLSRLKERTYLTSVKSDVSCTVKKLNESNKNNKRINIIATHVDLSDWKDIDIADVNNLIQEDVDIRYIFESTKGVSGYVYSSNLIDESSFNKLMQSIVDDSQI